MSPHRLTHRRAAPDRRDDGCRLNGPPRSPPPPPLVMSLAVDARTDFISTVACSTQSQDTHTHPFNGPMPGTTQVGRYQKGKTNLDFTGARDSEWQWHQLGHMQVCTLLQTDNHASTSLLSFLQSGCPSCRPINSVKALKATTPSQDKRK